MMLRILLLIVVVLLPDVAEAITPPSNRINVRNYRAKGDCVADDTAAIQNAINVAVSLGDKGTVYIPSGCYKISRPFDLIKKPIAIQGDGAMQTQLQVTTAMNGDLFKFSETWMANSFPSTEGSKMGSSQLTGVRLSGFSINGDRSTANTQNGIMFYDRNDHFLIEDVDVKYMRGISISIGRNLNTSQGYARESTLNDVHLRNCGNGANSPCLEITSTGTGDSTNLMTFNDLKVIFPFSKGVDIKNANTVKRTSSLFFNNLILHGVQTPASPLNFDLLYIDNFTSNIVVRNGDFNASYDNYHAVKITGVNGSEAPYLIDIHATMPSGSGGGVFVERGRNIFLDIMDCAVADACIKLGASAGTVKASDKVGQRTTDINPAASANFSWE